MKTALLLFLNGLVLFFLGAANAAALLPEADWQEYRNGFIAPEGRVIDVGNQGVSHSEGQGFGMLLALAADDQASFELLWEWTHNNLQREDGLFGWQWNPAASPPVQDWNNATDGDLLIAWALAQGGEHWKKPEWITEARRIAQRVRTTLIHNTSFGPVIMPGHLGFKDEGGVTLNPSYWVFPAFNTLARIDPDPVWKELTASGLTLLALTRFGPHQLPPDWVVLHPDNRLALPMTATKRRMGYEALRIPIYLCWAGLKDPILMDGFMRAWPSQQSPAWYDLGNGDRSAMPLGLSQRATRYLLAHCSSKASDLMPKIDAKDYYGSTLALFVRLILAHPSALS